MDKTTEMNNKNKIFSQQVSVEDEYKKNPDMDREQVQEFLTWIKSEPHLPHISEFEAIQGYHSCYFDMERAKATTECYYTSRTHFADIFSNMDILSDELKQAFETVTLVCLPGTTPKGYKVFIWKWNDTDPSKWSFAQTLKLFALLVTTMIYEFGTCPGYIALLDFQGSRLKHMLGLHLTTLMHGMKFVQDAIPIRLKEIEMINFPMRAPLPIVRPFIRKELYENLRFRRKVSDIYENIPAEMLPSDYPMGQSPSIKELRELWWNKMVQRREQFLYEEETHKVDESKRVNGGSAWPSIF